MANEDEDDRDYVVVVNDEEQYSIWLADKKPVPNGWRVIGEARKKADCLKYIGEVWTDMRPKSVRDPT
jgi:MbtH protein